MPKRSALPALSEAQLEIMDVVWEQRECSVATVWNALRRRRSISRNTIHTMIVRLEEKGWLARCEVGGRVAYRATASREQSQRHTVERLLKTVFNGSAESLVLTLLSSSVLTPAESARIRKAINQAIERKP